MKGKIGEKLREHLDSVKRNRILTELVRDVELPSASTTWAAPRSTARPSPP